MTVYPEEFIKAYDVKEKMFRDKAARDTEALQLREDGWNVTAKKFTFDGDERFFITAQRKKGD